MGHSEIESTSNYAKDDRLMLLDWTRHRPENYRLNDVLRSEWDDIKIVDLQHPEFILIGSEIYNNDDVFKGVARVGLFTDDMLFLNIPKLTWYCDAHGNIWPVWHERLPYRKARWNKARNALIKKARRDGEEIPGVGELYEERKMLASIEETLQRFTREKWVQHKMVSDTLL